MRQDILSSLVYAGLGAGDIASLISTLNIEIPFERGQVIAARGQQPYSGLLMTGHLCGRRSLADRGLQLLPVAIPGDLHGALDLICRPLDFDVVALSSGSVATGGFSAITALLEAKPDIARFWARARQLEEAILRERIVSLGARPGLSRLAHLFCEFVTRRAPDGLAPGEAVLFPFTQDEMAQSCGLSTIHLNRVLKELNRRQLVQTSLRRLRILDFDELARLADFNSRYLKSFHQSDTRIVDSAPC